jgi:SPX domain protein involved in polyphosphate accumulation
MEVQLIQGQFSNKDALEIITQMIHVKIKFHEDKITGESSEEDIKMREKRIKQLQKDLYEFRQFIERNEKPLNINAVIKLD